MVHDVKLLSHCADTEIEYAVNKRLGIRSPPDMTAEQHLSGNKTVITMNYVFILLTYVWESNNKNVQYSFTLIIWASDRDNLSITSVRNASLVCCSVGRLPPHLSAGVTGPLRKTLTLILIELWRVRKTEHQIFWWYRKEVLPDCAN